MIFPRGDSTRLGLCLPPQVADHTDLQRLFSFDTEWADFSEVIVTDSLADLDDLTTDSNVYYDNSTRYKHINL